MKTLLIIGSGIYQTPLIEYASQHYRVVLATPAVTEYIRSLVDKVLICDVRDFEKIINFAKKEKIDGVITDQTDIPVRTVARVAETLNLPGIGLDKSVLFTDKSLMRKKQIELGLPVPPCKTVENVEDAIAFFKELSVPVIIKPLDNQGSRGIQTVYSEEEMRQKFQESKRYSTSGFVLVEKFLKGTEFVIEGLVFNGEYRTLICGNTYYFKIKDAFAATSRCFPAVADKTLIERLSERNRQIIMGFGLKQGITHSEYIVADGEIYLLETAARGGGVFISSDLISLSTGLHTEEFLCKIALGEQHKMPILRDTGISCGYMAFYLPDGEVISLTGVDDVKRLSYVHRHILDEIYIGKINRNALDKTSRYALIVSAENRDQLSERMDCIRQMLQIKTKTNDGIKLPIWE